MKEILLSIGAFVAMTRIAKMMTTPTKEELPQDWRIVRTLVLTAVSFCALTVIGWCAASVAESAVAVINSVRSLF